MGLADFLATAGQGKTLGHVAEAFGGQTLQQQRVDEFVHKQLPALLQEIHGNTDETKVRELGGKFLTAAMTAGMPADGAEKMMEHLIGPALQGIRQEGLKQLSSQYAAQSAQPAQFAVGDKFAAAPLAASPSGPAPITPSGNFADAKPEKPLDLNFMMKYGDLIGAKPEERIKLLGVPGENASKLLSNQKTQGEIDKETQAQRQRAGLSNEPLGQGLPSLKDIGTLAPAGLPQTLPQREKPDDPLLEEKRREINARADRLDRMPTGGGISPYQQFNEAARMRTEFQNQSAPFQKVRDSFNRIQASGQNPSPAGDLSMVYNYMKMLDPGSVVRESEFASAAAAKPMLERLGLSWDAVGSVWSGKKLTTGQRQDFLNRANQLYQTEAKQHEQRVNETRRMATGFGVNPDLIISDMGAQPAPAGQGGYSGGQPSGSGSGQGGGSPSAQGQQLDAQGAAAILKEAGGDKNKAREIAKQRGYRF